MQKKLIALAVASLASGAAFAQTNVTMYGIADAGYIYSSGDPGFVQRPVVINGVPGVARVSIPGTNTFSGISSGLLSGSRLGFRGEEALGNGLKAIFTLEYSLNIDNNTGVGYSGSSTGLNARQQFVGLSSASLGTLALGRQYSPGYQATSNNDPAGGAAFEPQSFLTNQAGYTITPNTPARWNNAISYTTPNWGGFSAKAIYSFGESSVTTAMVPAAFPVASAAVVGTYNDKLVSITDNSAYGVGVNYANGPLNLDAVYQGRSSTNKVDTFNGFDTNEWYVGGSYDFKMVKLMGSWQGMSVDNTQFAQNVFQDSQVWQVGAVIPILAASNIHLGYSQLMWDGSSRALARLTGNSQSAMAGWTTNLSKRTTFYAGYVWTQNDNNSIGTAPVAGVGARGQDNNTVLAGLRHMF